jgi:hypothetical protein
LSEKRADAANVTHENDGPPEMQQQGWQANLDNYAKYAAAAQ